MNSLPYFRLDYWPRSGDVPSVVVFDDVIDAMEFGEETLPSIYGKSVAFCIWLINGNLRQVIYDQPPIWLEHNP